MKFTKNKIKSFLMLQTIFLFSIFITLDNESYILDTNPQNSILKNPAIDLTNLIPQFITLHTDNVNLSRLIFDMNFDILQNGRDVEVTTHYTYQNDGNNSVTNIVNIIDIETVLVNRRLSSIVVYDSEGDLYYEWSFIGENHIINITLREPLVYQKYYSYTITLNCSISSSCVIIH